MRERSRSNFPRWLAVHQEHVMSSQWTTSATALPIEGQSVEFHLEEGRETALDGTYFQRAFQTRWTTYDITRVRSWRVPNSMILLPA
jgi:hypothetical protein